MDESQPTTCNTKNAGSICPSWGMPRIEMPADVTMDDRGYIGFKLGTAEGPVHVRAYWKTWECRGTVAALVAGGLLRPEWCPGLPGNNKTRQQVLFDSDGPRLLLGNTRGKKQQGAHITVCRISARSFMVEVLATFGQQKRLEEFHERRRAKLDAEIERKRLACKSDVNEEVCDRENPEERARRTAGLADAMLNQLRGLALVEHKGLKLSIESQQRILRQMAELRRAFAEARVVATAPRCAQIENIICWPGRGSVAQVSPTALL